MITDAVAKSLSSIFESTFTGLDELFSSDEEKMKARAMLIELQNKIESEVNRELTRRAEADMKSDSWLAKNIRPMTLLAVVSIYVVVTIASGLGFNASASVMDILQAWGMMIFSFYFGSRGAEKIASTISDAINVKGKK